MPEKQLPARPSLEQYKKQAKELVRDFSLRVPEALMRLRHHHPRLHAVPEAEFPHATVSLTEAQLVLAREHGFESWPKFAHHIETERLIREVADPVSAFIEQACVPRHSGHSSGTLDHAEMILARYPRVAKSSIHTAAILADLPAVQAFLAKDPASATAKGGPYGWDALTHLCFSRYLRLDASRSEAFVRTARALLDAGASANTGWYETIDHPNPRQILESVLYGAAGIARHPGLTQLLLEYGADPNLDEETAYHVAEGYDNTVLTILLASGKFNQASLTTLAVRKADWHDYDGMQLVLEHGADPNATPIWGSSALQHALRRDNWIKTIELLLDHGAGPSLTSQRDGLSSWSIAARRGRGDVLRLFAERGLPSALTGLDSLIGACALADRDAIQTTLAAHPELLPALLTQGGTLLAEFSGTANLEGVRCLLDLGVSPSALYASGDGYFDIARDSTALHVAAWRACPKVVKELIARGAPIDARDARGRTALQLAIKAAVDSYWANRRTTESIADLLNAGASTQGIELPTGYPEADILLSAASPKKG
jgi:ankyrin repeat protein